MAKFTKKSDPAPKASEAPRRKRQAQSVSTEPLPPQPRSGEDEAASAVVDMLTNEPAYDLEGYELQPDRAPDPDRRERLRQTGDVDDAAAVIASMESDDFEDAPESDDDADPDDDGAEDEDPTDSDEDSEDAPEDEDSDDEDYDEGDPTKVHEWSDEDLDAHVKVKVQGEEITVPLREALAGFQRQADYSRKTAALAETRREAEALRDEAGTMASQYSQAIQAFDQLAGSLIQDPKARAQLGAIAAKARQDAEAAQAHATQATLQRESQALRDVMGWADEDAVRQGKRELIEAAQSFGFTPQDLSGVLDHRVLVVLDRAARYDAMQARGAEVKEAVKGKRRKSPTLQPGTRSGKSKADPARKAAQKARKALKQTGSIAAAETALLGMLGDED